MRSTGFFAFYGMLFCIGHCIIRRTCQKDYWGTTLFAGGLSGLSLLAEDPLRRDEVAFYCFPRILEILYRGGKKRGFIYTPKYSEVCLFSLAMGFIMYYMHKQPSIFNFIHRFAVRKVFGNN